MMEDLKEEKEMAGVQAPPSGEPKPATHVQEVMDLQQILDLFNIDLTKGKHFWVSKKLQTQ